MNNNCDQSKIQTTPINCCNDNKGNSFLDTRLNNTPNKITSSMHYSIKTSMIVFNDLKGNNKINKKHNSYQRYLANKKGAIFQKMRNCC